MTGMYQAGLGRECQQRGGSEAIINLLFFPRALGRNYLAIFPGSGTSTQHLLRSG